MNNPSSQRVRTTLEVAADVYSSLKNVYSLSDADIHQVLQILCFYDNCNDSTKKINDSVNVK